MQPEALIDMTAILRLKIRKLFQLSIPWKSVVPDVRKSGADPSNYALEIIGSDGYSYILKLTLYEEINGSYTARESSLEFAKRQLFQQKDVNLLISLKIKEGWFTFRSDISKYCFGLQVYQNNTENQSLEAFSSIFHLVSRNQGPDGIDVLPVFWSTSADASNSSEARERRNSSSYSSYDENNMVDSDDYQLLHHGNAEVTGNFRALNFYRTSDERLKTNVTKLVASSSAAKNILLCIDGVKYSFKKNPDQLFVGYLAQQIRRFIPEATQEINGVLHVDYTALIPYITEALKQYNTDISSLKSEAELLRYYLNTLAQQFQDQNLKNGSDVAVDMPSELRTKSLLRTRIPNWIKWIGSIILLATISTIVILIVYNSDNTANAPNDNPTQVSADSTICQSRCNTGHDEQMMYKTFSSFPTKELNGIWWMCQKESDESDNSIILHAINMTCEAQVSNMTCVIQFMTSSSTNNCELETTQSLNIISAYYSSFSVLSRLDPVDILVLYNNMSLRSLEPNSTWTLVKQTDCMAKCTDF